MNEEQVQEIIEKLDRLIALLEQQQRPQWVIPIMQPDWQPQYNLVRRKCPVCGKENCLETHITCEVKST